MRWTVFSWAVRAFDRALSIAKQFRFTLLAACVVVAAASPRADDLLLLWLEDAPLGAWGRPLRPQLVLSGDSSLFFERVHVIALTTGVLIAPVFAANLWLFVCRTAGAPSARWLALPFALVTAGIAVASIAAARALLPHAIRMLLFT